MKATKLTYLLVLGMALTFAATGCKKKPTPITPLPGARMGPLTDNNPNPLPSGPKYNPDEGVKTGPGGGDTTGLEQFEGMIADRAALAAETVHFAFDSSVVKSSEKSKVEAVAEALKKDPATKLLIEGHCDERGTEEYNRSLGERRALALREALAKIGVSPDRVRTLSFGKDRPVDQGHDESAWQQNRRGEFVLLHPKP